MPRITAKPQLSQHKETNGNGGRALPSMNGTKYAVRESPMFDPRPIRIIGIGAGASGINMIRTLRQTLSGLPFEHVVYEKNKGIGGTWLENRYPGCRCDVPSHSYQFSWRKNPSWSNLFASAAEIEGYLRDICDEEDMWGCIRTSHRVLSAVWSEEKSVWQVEVENTGTKEVVQDVADFLIDASGILNNWSWPDIPGREDFEGQMIHTAAWPEGFNVDGKVVAIIGNGASGLQVLPQIVPRVKKLYHPVRTPTWVLPPRIATMKMGAAAPVINQVEMGPDGEFTPAQIQRFRDDPTFYELFIRTLDLDSNLKFALSLVDGSPQQQWAAQKCREFMTAALGGDRALCEALIPAFPIGCRRLTPAPGYLEAMRDPKVSVVTEGIKRFVRGGIELATGEVLEVDAVICATGFGRSFRPPFPIVGRKGNLQDVWRVEAPASYMSVGIAGMPNYFKFLGPHAPIAHGDIFKLSEHIARYVARAIRKCQTEGILSICPSDAAVAEYAAHVEAFMPRTAWAGACRSWYKGDGDGDGDGDGSVVALHPGSRLHFLGMLAEFRGEDWEYVYAAGNRFAYLGNGFTGEEAEAMKRMNM
ncbi:related to steroid monooxygenase [Cephalotrichum gorgonifer]|uniref:Related to steroid monooxygenase n=1 Tax=Cephalotrichum gorgonifer TaxID=2041049 RepID=A0AAE8MQT9_9PEZI|nr:related to steroid monooxygenase [Cephalotrichum gorgonifer]